MDKVKPKYNMVENTWYAIKHAAKYEKTALLLIIIDIIGGILVMLANLYLPKTVVASIENGDSVNKLIFSILFLLLIIAIGSIAEDATHEYINVRLKFLRTKMAIFLSHKSLTSCYESTEDPEYKTAKGRACECVDRNYRGTEQIYWSLELLLYNGISFIIYILLLFSVNPIIVIITILTSSITYFVGRKYNLWCYDANKESGNFFAKRWSIIQCCTDLKKAKDIRLFGMQNWIMEITKHYNRLHGNLIKKIEKKGLQTDFINITLSVLREGISYSYLIYLAIKGEINASDFVLFLTAINGFATKIGGLFTCFEFINNDCLEIDAVRSFLDYPDKFNLDKGIPVDVTPNNQYCFEFKNVQYKYPGSENYALIRINLKIAAGEKLAIVGLNGAGKTTFIKLMAGLYDPTDGEVLINGENIKKYNRQNYYKLFSAVFQDFSILPLSIKQNIAQSVDDINENRVLECIQKANLEKKIKTLEDGLESMLDRKVHENAIDMSGGELQRLMLARALYKDAPVILLDEPTAALDPLAESEIYQRYNDLTKGRTSVFISHRLASTRFCDRILYLEDGAIVEEGTHDELMRLRGKYYELFEIQSKYYREEEKESV